MTQQQMNETALRTALDAPSSSARLRAVLAAGTRPDPDYVEALVEQCAIEPDFYVRDMLTWALIHHDASSTIDRLLIELRSDSAQARSQALHTLSKIGDERAWPAVAELLDDEDDEVARTAWRTAVGLVPEEHQAALAETLSTQFDRGDREVQLSLSRAFAALGEAASPVIERAKTAEDPGVRSHAIATERIMLDPEEGFDAAIAEAHRVVALLGAPTMEE